MALIARPSGAQTSNEATEFVHVIDMRVQVAHAPLYAAPRQNAEVLHTLAWNERILVLAQVGSFYKVVRPEGGPQGYIRSTQLRSAVNPLRAAEMPEDLRRRRTYVGARFDLQGGVAVPHGASTFSESFRPGVGLGARLSYPLRGALGLTARMAYRQFAYAGESTSPRWPPHVLPQVDVHARDLTLLAGALGLDLTLFRGHWMAFVATVDGGAYHIVIDESVPALQRSMASTATWAWGGSAAIRMSVRLGTRVRLFAEPSYEMVRTEAGGWQFLPARIGLSLER